MDTQLAECAAYFVDGGPVEWIFGGGLFVLFIVTALSKNNIPHWLKMAKDIAKVIVSRKK